jgi:hypothetical protein
MLYRFSDRESRIANRDPSHLFSHRFSNRHMFSDTTDTMMMRMNYSVRTTDDGRMVPARLDQAGEDDVTAGCWIRRGETTTTGYRYRTVQ